MSPRVWARPWHDREKVIQTAIHRLYVHAGCKVYNLSQARASNQTPGLPDLWIMAPISGAAWWHEVKALDGKQTPPQRDFQARCLVSGIAYVVGGLEDAEAKLESIGLMRRLPTGQRMLVPAR